MRSEDYERLGAFFLGRGLDPQTGEEAEGPLLYDSRDLTTHAVIVGMTGSGKTGLAIGLLEEALIDGIPVIAIDPKGDLGNLLLSFPELRPEDFRPWIDEGAAARAGQSPDAYASAQARLWREGLASWGQGGDRIARLHAAGERLLYTPGSQAGRPLGILRSLDVPAAAELGDVEALRDRIRSSVSGLLGLLGIEADPLQSREHVLLSKIVERTWREGRGLDLATLIRQIQKPPLERIGVLDLETFYPAADRMQLAMRLNNLLASPGFGAWLEGEPLDIGRLLRAPDGRPRLSVLSIAHLSDEERMFVVTLVLGQLLSWMRAQSGSQTLRAILYMDEVFGYFPPSANPPSKTPMLTLLKQARAYGVGCVLATQNPVDLDYKGLSNCGTWMLGRLQTERDKARVLDGLEGAASSSPGALERGQIGEILSRLEGRTFLMNNVHEDHPVLFRTRWAMSYLAGPLSRAQIERLGEAAPPARDEREAARERSEAALRPAAQAVGATPRADEPVRPMVPAVARERFVPVTRAVGASDRLLYRPILLGEVTAHYSQARAQLDEWLKHFVWAPLEPELEGPPWEGARRLAAAPALDSEPEEGAGFARLPGAAEREKSYGAWSRQLASHVYREYPICLFRSKQPRLLSRPGEEEGSFRGRLADARRELRDAQLEKLRRRYAPKLARLQERIDRANERVLRERAQYQDRRTQTVLSVGATLVGALFGRKLASARNVGRASSALKGASRTARERADVSRAEARVEECQEKLAALEREFEESLEEVEDVAAAEAAELETLRVRARRSALEVDRLSLVWVPFRVGASGGSERIGSLEPDSRA